MPIVNARMNKIWADKEISLRDTFAARLAECTDQISAYKTWKELHSYLKADRFTTILSGARSGGRAGLKTAIGNSLDTWLAHNSKTNVSNIPIFSDKIAKYLGVRYPTRKYDEEPSILVGLKDLISSEHHAELLHSVAEAHGITLLKTMGSKQYEACFRIPLNKKENRVSKFLSDQFGKKSLGERSQLSIISSPTAHGTMRNLVDIAARTAEVARDQLADKLESTDRPDWDVWEKLFVLTD